MNPARGNADRLRSAETEAVRDAQVDPLAVPPVAGKGVEHAGHDHVASGNGDAAGVGVAFVQFGTNAVLPVTGHRAGGNATGERDIAGHEKVAVGNENVLADAHIPKISHVQVGADSVLPIAGDFPSRCLGKVIARDIDVSGNDQDGGGNAPAIIRVLHEFLPGAVHPVARRAAF